METKKEWINPELLEMPIINTPGPYTDATDFGPS